MSPSETAKAIGGDALRDEWTTPDAGTSELTIRFELGSFAIGFHENNQIILYTPDEEQAEALGPMPANGHLALAVLALVTQPDFEDLQEAVFRRYADRLRAAVKAGAPVDGE